MSIEDWLESNGLAKYTRAFAENDSPSVVQKGNARSAASAMSALARLWSRQGKRKPALELLAPVYEWFTEGYDTLDLQEAKRLLDTLA